MIQETTKLDFFQRDILFDIPREIDPEVPAWIGHIPFAFLIIDLLRPGCLVELGVHSGNSYNAFCQAVKKLELPTQCYGIDNWEGDQQAGFYQEDIFRKLSDYQQREYADFSKLIRSDFDEALSRFEDGQIDLLHIDGWHTYDAVKYDFETWLPKVSKRGVILFHDISVKKGDFGAWKFWEEIKSRYPSMAFQHSNGLGVLGVGEDLPSSFQDFLELSLAYPVFTENLFARLGANLFLSRQEGKGQTLPTLPGNHYYVQLFLDTGYGFKEDISQKTNIPASQSTFHFDLSGKGAIQAIRFDPANYPVQTRIHEIIIEDEKGHAVPFEFRSNASIQIGDYAAFTSIDPNILLKLDKATKLKSLKINIEYPYIHFFDKKETVGESQDSLGSSIQTQLIEKALILSGQEELLREKASYINSLKLQVNQLEQALDKTEVELSGLREHHSHQEDLLRAKSDLLFQTRIEFQKKELEALNLHYQVEAHKHQLQLGEEVKIRLEQRISSQNKVLAEKDQEIVDLQHKLALQTSAANGKEKYLGLLKSDLEKSQVQLSSFQELVKEREKQIDHLLGTSSYRWGRWITTPGRYLHKKFIAPRGYVWMSLQFLKTLFTRPGRFIRNFSLKNLGTLIKAWRTEPPTQIVRNMMAKLKGQEVVVRKVVTTEEGKEKVEYIETPARSTYIDDGGIIIHCDKALYSQETQELEISGWAIAEYGIEKVEIFNDEELLGQAEYGGMRNDVGDAHPDYPESRFSGFSFSGKGIEMEDEIVIRAFDNAGESQKLISSLNLDLKRLSLNQQYEIFLRQNKPSIKEVQKMKSDSKTFLYRPKISIVTPVFNVPKEYLDKCIKSIRNQYYDNWELCLYDDASTKEETIQCLEKWQKKDDRIKVVLGKNNLHISGASNEAIKMASGEFIALLDNDDELTPDALYEVVKALNKDSELDYIYSDEDKIDLEGNYCDPHFKSDLNPDLILSNNYFCHLSVVRKELGDTIGWFRNGYEGSQDYDLFLRIIDRAKKIHHIPKVLYHWRKIPGSTSSEYSEKGFADLAAQKALSDYLKRNNIAGEVSKGFFPGSFRVRRFIENPEMVSIIIPFKDKVDLLKTCVKSVLSKTEYANYEILLISNNSEEPETFEYLEDAAGKIPNLRYFEHNVPFNFSEINNWAVQHANGEYILLLNNDIEVITKGWLTAMVEHIQRPEVGAVGAKLLYPDNTIQHGGVIMKVNGVAAHAHRNLHDKSAGYFFRAGVIQNLSACTAACLLVKKTVYEEVGGMDAENLKVAFNDIDLCMKIREKGYLIVYTPYAKLYHFESKSRGSDTTPDKIDRFRGEIFYFQEKWEKFLENGDPYYNPNLSLKSEDFSLNIE